VNTQLILQIFIGLCLLALIISLFFDKWDYLLSSIAVVFISIIVSTFLIPLETPEDFIGIILAVDWEVICFLICIFTIVEILKQINFFDAIAKRIVNKFYYAPRKLFYAMCITSTLIAALIQDLSVAVIFVPIAIEACRKMKISAVPYLFGITICINIASTLTPFGSAENLIIASHFNLPVYWFLVYLGVYFVVVTAITLLLLDRILLKKYIEQRNLILENNIQGTEKNHSPEIQNHSDDGINVRSSETDGDAGSKSLLKIQIERNVFIRNLIGLIFFVILLGIIPQIIITGPIGLILFVLLNPIKQNGDKKRPDVSYFLRKIDPKLIYFFICLFIMVYMLDLIGLVQKIEELIESWSTHNIIVLSIEIIVITSVLSGFLDNAPLTIMLIPIISKIITHSNIPANPVLMSFTLGINLGNFLPQGAACDMMTLELARKNNVEGFTYKSLTIVGGLFALLHVALGVGYVSIFSVFFP